MGVCVVNVRLLGLKSLWVVLEFRDQPKLHTPYLVVYAESKHNICARDGGVVARFEAVFLQWQYALFA